MFQNMHKPEIIYESKEAQNLSQLKLQGYLQHESLEEKILRGYFKPQENKMITPTESNEFI